MACAPNNQIIPGLLKFRKLAVNKGQITRAEEKRMESVIKTQDNLIQSDIYSEKFRNAARNVQAVMLYHSSKKSEAIEIWEKVLTLDPTNLNALQDITLAYQKLRYDLKAKEYEEKQQNMLQHANPDNEKMMLARARFEQGYALSQDTHTQSWKGISLVERRAACYEEALMMACGLIDQEEKRDWVLYTAKAYERLGHVSFRADDPDLSLCYIKMATEKLHEALQMSDNNAIYLSEIWLTMGNAFARNVKEVVHGPDCIEQYYEEWKDPMICYTRALQYNPNNLWLLGCIGNYYFKQTSYDKTALAEAKKMFTTAINAANELPAEDPQKNTSSTSLVYRAKTAIKETKYQKDINEQYKSLLQAQNDACKALELSQSPMSLTVVGHVHHMLSKHPLTPKNKVVSLRNKALDRFYEASVTQDGSTVTDLHLKWAECLQDAKDLPSAIESFKIAFDSSGSHDPHYRTIIASKLLCVMFEHYTACGRPEYLIEEVAFWFIYTQKNCKDLSNRRLHEKYSAVLSDVEKYIRQPESVPRANQKADACSPALHAARPLTEGVDYDVYILNEEEDENIIRWIKCSLLTGLESSFFGLKAYYHETHSRLGELPQESKAMAMEKSAKILIILSHGFNGEKDLTTEMAQCLQAKNTENVIVLQREQVEVPTKLRCYRKFDFTVTVDLPELARYLLPVRTMLDI